MTHATTVVMDLDRSKLAAHAIKKRFDELNAPIKLNHAYEALAIAHRHPNWATMKAAMKATPSGLCTVPSGSADDSFSVGIHWKFENRKRVEEQISISWKEALNHIHGFSTSHEARHDLLLGLSANAIRGGGTSIFVEPVSDMDTKSRLINGLLRHSTANGRRDDYFVLDLSVEGSRLGNTCDILKAMRSGDVVEFLLHGFHGPHFGDHARLTLTYCVDRILQGTVQGDAPDLITIDAVCRELEVLEVHGYPQAILDKQALSFGAATSELPEHLKRHLRAFALKHHRLLDENSHWPGFDDVLKKPQTLLIFIDDGDSPLTGLLSRVVIDALRTVIERAEADKPGMLLLNDVDFLRKGLAERATQNGVCLVIADQCPTPPRHLASAPLSFRSETMKNNSGMSSHHELVTSMGERWLYPGRRVKTANSG